MKYISFKNYQDILKMNKFWFDRCENERKPDGSVYHHLPLHDINGDPIDLDNIFVNKVYRKDFIQCIKQTAKYRKAVEAADKKSLTLNYGIMDMRQILPPWFVYPYYPAKQLMLTEYFSIFQEFIARMKPMEVSVYKGLYPVPEYIESIFTYK